MTDEINQKLDILSKNLNNHISQRYISDIDGMKIKNFIESDLEYLIGHGYKNVYYYEKEQRIYFDLC